MDSRERAAAQVAAVVDGQAITLEEVDAHLGAKLVRVRSEEYQLRERALNEIIESRIVQREAKRSGRTVDALLQQATTEAATDIQEQAVKVFRAFPGRFSGQSEAEAIAEISSGLAAQRTVERKKELVAKANVTVERKLQPYRVAIVPVEAATLGEASAPVEIVEFSDFQCPYCARASSTVKQVLERYAGRVRLTFRHYPLTVIHKDAAKAAEAASCAGDQKRFWEMHDRLFANPQALRVTDLKKAAADLGLDSAKFDACLENGQHTSTWKRDLRAGQDYGVGGTPTFFINGRLVPGSPTVEAFAVLIEQELALNPAAASGPSMR